MAVLLVLSACVCATLAAPSGQASGGVKDVDFLMPSVQPKVADTYLCIPMKMGKTPKYIVGYKPHANMAIAHHMLLYGCATPGDSQPVWNCGEMAVAESEYNTGPVCGSGASILYAWAMDAPALTLPEDVGFKVGGDTGVNYLVLQVHYKDVSSFLPPGNGHDSSGITMTMTDKPQKRRAGVYLMGTSGKIDPHTVTYMETACDYNLSFDVHPFAFRTHAHTLGKVTSGYRIRNGEWTEIGRQSPQKPQMFYNATTQGMVIKKGDTLAARCTMKNDLDHVVRIGSTQNDEMCNFYMMYYTEEGDHTMPNTYCFSGGPPGYYWAYDHRMQNKLDTMPRTVSVIPGETEPLQQTAEPGLYENQSMEDNDVDNIYDVKGADMNVDINGLPQYEIEELLEYFRQRGPRADDEDEYVYRK